MKSVRFQDWRYIGDPINSVKILNEKAVDEIIVLDVDASLYGREPNYELISSLAGECFAPMGVGGGVTSAAIANRLVSCGIDKVLVNSSFMQNPDIVSEIAAQIGSSSTVASIDVIKGDSGFLLFQHLGQKILDRGVEECIRSAEESGAGEILVQNVSRDGTRLGLDHELVTLMISSCRVPLVYAGGISSLESAKNLWQAGIGGVGAGSWFFLREPHSAVLVSYPSSQNRL